jgi:hypothetical protein
MNFRPLAPLALLSALASASCAVPSEDRPGEAAPGDAVEDELAASCTYARKYFVTLHEGACVEVPGHGGSWVPEPIFPDAPPEVQESSCALRWVGERSSRADIASLEARHSPEDVLTPACGEGAAPTTGVLREIPHIDNLTHGGSVGCDVCALEVQRHIWVVLPPEKVYLRQLEARLSNGESRAFQIEAPAGARAVSLELPPPPAGTTYVAGSVRVY